MYPKDALKKVSKGRVRRFFDLVNGKYQIKSGVRDLCIFARHNLAEDPPFSRMDLISCRNVLIYLEPVLQNEFLRRSVMRYETALPASRKIRNARRTSGFKIADRKNKFFMKAAMTAAYKAKPVAFREDDAPREAFRRGGPRLRLGERGRPRHMGNSLGMPGW